MYQTTKKKKEQHQEKEEEEEDKAVVSALKPRSVSQSGARAPDRKTEVRLETRLIQNISAGSREAGHQRARLEPEKLLVDSRTPSKKGAVV